MDDIYKNIEEYNPNKKRKTLIFFDDMIADMLSNKKINPIITELFIRGRKLNISLAFITQSYFAVPKNIPNKQEHLIIHQILTLKTAKPYSFLVTDANLASDNPSRFRKNLLERI